MPGPFAPLRPSRFRLRKEAVADVLGLGALLLLLLDYLRPALLLLPTLAAGGDTPCHVPTAALACELFAQGRLHGWYPGAYLGHPLLLYYFPLPFGVMAALEPFTGLAVAFKLGTVGGVFLLPLAAYGCVRLMGFVFPVPLVTAASAVVFLFLEENPIWGGTLASTLTGEFSYTYGTAFALLFLGVVYRASARGSGPPGPAAVLALTALAHGYAVLWAGLSATFLLLIRRDSGRALRWLLAVAVLSFMLAAVFLLPLLSAWGWTTPYDDPWITVTSRNLVPPLLWPLLAAALVGTVVTVLDVRRGQGGEESRRFLFLLYAALTGVALAAGGPALGIIDIRFVPFAQLALCLAGAATVGRAMSALARPDLAALAFCLVAGLFADSRSQVLRSWIDWNYTGLEAKELWPAFRAMTERLKGGVQDPRVAVEYGTVHEKAGSIRMYETLPYFSGRSTLEGVYNQASLQTHPVYYLASELNALSPNPFRRREYSTFDTDNALRHLRLFNVSDIVAVSARLTDSLSVREDVLQVARIPPYTIFRLSDRETGYVEPLAFAPVRSSPRDFREKAYRWFTRKPQGRAHLVFTEDPRFEVVEKEEWLAPPEVPLPDGVEVKEQVEAERISITTNRPGHPLLVKVSYHPRWRAIGADGPYLVTPALMMVVPRQREVQLVYARNWADGVGLALSLTGLLGSAAAAALAWRRRRSRAASTMSGPIEPASPPRRAMVWIVRALPLALLGLLAAGRLVVLTEPAGDAGPLYEMASRAFTAERWADAAEYARHALSRERGTSLRPELLCLRGESLLRAGQAAEAARSFEAVLDEAGGSPYVPQALFGLAAAREASGKTAGAALARARLKEEFPETPWARRLGS